MEAKTRKGNLKHMKIGLVKTVITLLLFASAWANMVVAATAGVEATDGGRAGRLEGTWNMQITLNDCSGHVIRSFPTLVAFIAGGTLTEASGGTAPALVTGGKGVWSHTTHHSYAFRFKDFNFNSSYVLTGWSIISGETTVDETGNGSAGPATVEVYNASGVLVASLCADAVGTRFEL